MKNAGMKKTLERGVRAVFGEQSIEQKSVGENSEKRKFVERSLSGLAGVVFDHAHGFDGAGGHIGCRKAIKKTARIEFRAV